MVKSLVSLSTAAFLTVLAVPSADAAPSCAADHVCMWEDSGYTGSRYVSQKGTSGTYDIDGWNGDNEISSLRNNTSCKVTLYSADSPKDSAFKWTVGANKNISNLKNLKDRKGNHANDSVQSFVLSC